MDNHWHRGLSELIYISRGENGPGPWGQSLWGLLLLLLLLLLFLRPIWALILPGFVTCFILVWWSVSVKSICLLLKNHRHMTTYDDIHVIFCDHEPCGLKPYWTWFNMIQPHINHIESPFDINCVGIHMSPAGFGPWLAFPDQPQHLIEHLIEIYIEMMSTSFKNQIIKICSTRALDD